MKGKTTCNRTACQDELVPGHIWYNEVMGANYCPSCAALINESCEIAEPLCVIEKAGREEWCAELLQEIKDLHPEDGLNSPRDIPLTRVINQKAALLDMVQKLKD